MITIRYIPIFPRIRVTILLFGGHYMMNQAHEQYMMPVPSKRSFRQKSFFTTVVTVYIKLTFIFLLFVFLGVIIYALLAPILYQYHCPLVDSFFQLKELQNAGFVAISRQILVETRTEQIYLLIGVIAAFSYLCPAISYIFVSLFGISLGTALGFLRYALTLMDCLPQDILWFIVFRAICSAVILYVFIQAILVARYICTLQEHTFRLACRLIWHQMIQAFFCYCIIFAAAFCFLVIL